MSKHRNVMNMARLRPQNPAKAHGIQYTPPELADFLAERMMAALKGEEGPLTVLDPACGTGVLLRAFWEAATATRKTQLIGYERDAAAIALARERLTIPGMSSCTIERADFLTLAFGMKARATVDAIIANPPYVRTQTLGARQSQRLAARFDLRGRVDLYQAFAAAMSWRLKPRGILGLLISNRFLTTRSGASLRTLLLEEFDIQAIYDLGDTRLFPAAVLPAIVIARKGRSPQKTVGCFDRVYETRQAERDENAASQHPSVLQAIRDNSICGLVRSRSLTYFIERGRLLARSGEEPWSLATSDSELWLKCIHSRQAHTFGDLAHVRVGIKTTADEVFIRSNWNDLPDSCRPEEELLRPLLTHHEASRWKSPVHEPPKMVLYPHETRAGKRRAIELTRFPRAAKYLAPFRERLEARHYLRDAGRKWFEIWVPHQPAAWAQPKIVWPDISEQPRFFLDESSAVVNGDCYWITLRNGPNRTLLLLLLAIANSSFAVRFYDTLFHNKLYAGRRRFMTQYVARFPVPDPQSPTACKIVELTEELCSSSKAQTREERELNRLIELAFGLTEDSVIR